MVNSNVLKVQSYMVKQLVHWVIICNIVGMLLLKKESIIYFERHKHPLEINLMRIYYSKYWSTILVKSYKKLNFKTLDST